MEPERILDGVFLVGSADISDSRDCMVYLLDVGELILIDTGAGPGLPTILSNIRWLGFDPTNLSTIILTHCHIDHIGGAHELKTRYGTRIIMHELDAAVVESGDTKATAAHWYGLPFPPLPVDHKLSGSKERLTFGQQEVVCLHTPGHTPGSISIYMDRAGKRILFGQDIHGPFFPEFGSNIFHWQKSMKDLLALKADILCEGHFGVYQPNKRVTEYIERYLDEYGE
ncbi:MAG: MBL fold metallo-hydrolase [Syntrophorhabdus aromaticivorans]|uniref:MBL fold metallo-hydrolase n=1 Tax=Syntrophorhabdus aromaticivorans TaxID=328301 RepID=A0A351U0H3_9BACT|nr:MBL fold metallo-hydrolase [Syntrophorhabdus aromaticivorans]HBA53454.1 Zn-dependent hydrolase [Syntrophorhabdus aromaticivorans]